MKTLKIKTGTVALFYSLLFLFTVTGSLAQAANITVNSSRNPVSLDDSFHLTYEADSSVDDDPDFTPIYQYFDVLSSSQSTNMRSINGSWSLKKSWDLSVIAKDIGTVTIPAISFGKDTSPAIRITVTNSTSANSGTPNSASPNSQTSNQQATVPAKLFLETSVDKKSSWIQAQIIYKVRLFRTVNLVGASISEPTTNDPDAIIEAIGEDDYQSTKNGISYNVFERSYAIFPQKSGTLKINPVTFEGRVQATQPRSIFDQFRMSGQLKRLRSKPVSVEVKHAPSQINLQDWLPASNLAIVEDWSDDINDIKAGEPITRTVTIVAQGLTAVQLPELSFDDIKDLKQYPDKAITENRQDTSGLTGLKQIKVALIPAKAGNYTLPEIKLEWWNTTTNKKEVATLPETVLVVTGTAKENTYPQTPAGQITQDQKNLTPGAESSGVPTPPTVIVNNEPYWKWLSLLLAFAWLATLFLLIRRTAENKQPREHKVRATSVALKPLTSSVNNAAKTGDAKKTRAALIEWAQIFYNNKNITNLTQIAELCTPQLESEIKQLNQALYSSDTPEWQGKNLLAAFQKEAKMANNKKPGEIHASALRPLYNK